MAYSNWKWPTVVLLTVVSICWPASSSRAQFKTDRFNEREIEPQLHAYDKPENYTLKFRFKDPRIITVDVPARGKKIVWYMWYQVINPTSEPRLFVPDFELKTHDYESVHQDEVMPFVQAAISKIENPTGKMPIMNSVTISKEPIPVSKPDAYPRAITGVAIWTDVYDRAPKTNRFSIFVGGLSDAWRQDPKTPENPNPPIRRKTLQINFKRLGDDIQNDPNAIRWVDDPSWIYRATDIPLIRDKGKNPQAKNIIIENVPESAPEVRPVLQPNPRDLLLPPAAVQKQ